MIWFLWLVATLAIACILYYLDFNLPVSIILSLVIIFFLVEISVLIGPWKIGTAGLLIMIILANIMAFYLLFTLPEKRNAFTIEMRDFSSAPKNELY